MNPDIWLWAGAGFGHVVLTIWLFNVTHAFGLDERRVKVVKLLIPALFVLIAGLLVAQAGQGRFGHWVRPAQAYAVVCIAVALGVFPLVTVARARRRGPRGISERTEEVDLLAGRDREAFLGAGKHAWMLRLPGNESLRLRKREWEVALPGLPPAWDGLSVVQVTDLHFAPCFKREFFEAVADAVSGWEADLVLFTGDLVDHDDTIPWILPVLSRLRGRLGNYAILGNHDVTHQPARVLDELTGAGFTSLDGRWERLDVAGRTLVLGGTSYPWGALPDIDAVPEGNFRLLLSHSPDQFYRAARWGIDLMLSGHNHGGQIRLPVVGPVFMPSVYSRRFDRGFFRADETLLHVSQGVSGMHPLRYGCVPEVSRLTLRAETPVRRSIKSRRADFTTEPSEGKPELSRGTRRVGERSR